MSLNLRFSARRTPGARGGKRDDRGDGTCDTGRGIALTLTARSTFDFRRAARRARGGGKRDDRGDGTCDTERGIALTPTARSGLGVCERGRVPSSCPAVARRAPCARGPWWAAEQHARVLTPTPCDLFETGPQATARTISREQRGVPLMARALQSRAA
jgi:hypothetical protein